VALTQPGVPISLFVEGWAGYAGFNAIITGFQAQTRDGVQYLHTLRDLVYVYVFGPRITPVQIQGLAFAIQCENLVSLFGGAGHGLEYAFAYYLLNRVSSRGTPVSMVLGQSTPFIGFLDGASFSLVDPERLLGQWSFNFSAIPQPSLLDLLTG